MRHEGFSRSNWGVYQTGVGRQCRSRLVLFSQETVLPHLHIVLPVGVRFLFKMSLPHSDRLQWNAAARPFSWVHSHSYKGLP